MSCTSRSALRNPYKKRRSTIFCRCLLFFYSYSTYLEIHCPFKEILVHIFFNIDIGGFNKRNHYFFDDFIISDCESGVSHLVSFPYIFLQIKRSLQQENTIIFCRCLFFLFRASKKKQLECSLEDQRVCGYFTLYLCSYSMAFVQRKYQN